MAKLDATEEAANQLACLSIAAFRKVLAEQGYEIVRRGELSMWRGIAQDAYNEDSGLHCWDEADERIKDVLEPDWRES